MFRSTIRTRVRDYLYESVADILTDAQINRFFEEELRSLPRRNIYIEEIWTTTTVQNQQDYTLPENTLKVEELEKNAGTSSVPIWVPILGYEQYAGAIFLPYLPSSSETIRAKIKKRFTVVTDDSTALDIDADKSEILVWGIVIRSYKALIGYFRNSKHFDAVTLPSGVSMASVQSWLRDAKQEYRDLLALYATQPKPKDIDLVG